MRDFISALTRYAIDPGEWSELLEKFDRLGSVLESWDPTQLIAELSRAEALNGSPCARSSPKNRRPVPRSRMIGSRSVRSITTQEVLPP